MQYTPTKKERRALRRAAKAEARAQQTNTGHWRRGFNWLLGVVIAGLAIWGLVVLVQSTQRPAEIISDKLAIAADDWHKGPAEAKATLVEYGDFQCPACKAAEPTVKKVLADFKDRVRLVYRDFPLDMGCNPALQRQLHPFACKAALAANCANEQGKFWAYHDVLFERQPAFSDENLKKYAADLGLVSTQFDACLDSSKHLDEIKKDLADGSSLGIQGTPTFFVNGRMLSDRTYDDFKAAIESAQ